MAVTHSTVVVVADDGTSPVGTNEWNADHATATVSLSGASANKDQLLIPDATFGAGLTIGGDTNLYRSAANFLRTDDNLSVASVLYMGAYAGGPLTAGDIVARRSATTGAYYFGDNGGTVMYLYFDGTNFSFGTGGLSVPAQITQNAGKSVLDTDHTAAADPHTGYRLESEAIVESNVYAQNPGTFTIPTEGRLTQPVRLALSSTNRLTDAGTGRAVVSDAPTDPSALKYRSPGSVVLTSDEYVTEFQRVELRGNSRKSMFGTARSIITGFAPGGRLVLAGTGGGS